MDAKELADYLKENLVVDLSVIDIDRLLLVSLRLGGNLIDEEAYSFDDIFGEDT